MAGTPDYKLASFSVFDQPAAKPEPTSSSGFGAFGRGAVRGVGPAAAGLAAGIPGAEAGALALSELGPIGMAVGAIGGGLLTGLPAAYAASYGQQKLLQAAPDVATALGQSPEQMQADVGQHPYASMAGELAPNLAAFRPSLSAFSRTAGKTGAALDEINLARVNALTNAAVGGGMELGNEIASGEPVDLTRVALATSMGALGQKETALGGKVAGLGRAAMPAEMRARVDALFGRNQPEAAPAGEKPPIPMDDNQMRLFTDEQAPIVKPPEGEPLPTGFPEQTIAPPAPRTATETVNYQIRNPEFNPKKPDAAPELIDRTATGTVELPEPAVQNDQQMDMFADQTPVNPVRDQTVPAKKGEAAPEPTTVGPTQAEILQHIRSANADEFGFLPVTDTTMLRHSSEVSRLLGEDPTGHSAYDYVSGQANKLQNALDGLETKNVSGKKIDQLKAQYEKGLSVLKGAQDAIDTFTGRQAQERRGELVNYAREGLANAKPGVRIGEEPVSSGTEQQMRERNAAQQNAEDEAAARADATKQKADMDAAIADSDRRVADLQAQRTAARRNDILSQVLDDPTTRNPYQRFVATLRKNGIRDLTVTPEEQARINRHEDLKATFEEETPQADHPNKGKSPQLQKLERERMAAERAADEDWQAAQDDLAERSQPNPREQRRVNPADRTNPENFRLEMAPTGDDAERLAAADAKRARQAAAREPVAEEPLADEGSSRKQGELFKKNGEPTKAALGETAQQLRNEAAFLRSQVKGKKSQGMMDAAIAAMERGDADINLVRKTYDALRRGKYREAAEGLPKVARKRITPRNVSEDGDEPPPSSPPPTSRGIRSKKGQEQAAQAREPSSREEPSGGTRSEQAAQDPVSSLHDIVDDLESRGAIDERLARRLRDELNEDEPNLEMVQATVARYAREAGATKATPDEAAQVEDYLKRNPRTVRFREGEGESSGMAVEDAKAVVEEAIADWQRKPEIEVVNTVDELPAEAREGRTGRLLGSYVNGKLYLVAGEHSTPAELRATMWHEALGHYGMRGKFGRALDTMLARMYNSNAALREAAHDWLGKRVGSPHIQAMTTEHARILAVEEVLANSSMYGPLKGNTGGMWAQIKSLVREYLRKIPGLGDRIAYTDEDVRQFLRRSHEYVTEGKMGARQPADESAPLMRDEQSVADKTIESLPAGMQEPARKIWDNIAYAAKRGITTWGFTENIAESAVKSGVKSANDYVRVHAERTKIANEAETRIDDILGKVDRLSIEDRRKVNAFLEDSTRAGKWGYDADHVRSKQALDGPLKAQFYALTPDAQDIVKDVFRHGSDTLRRKQEGVIRAITDEYSHELTAIDKKLAERFNELVGGSTSDTPVLEAMKQLYAENKDGVNGDAIRSLTRKFRGKVTTYKTLMGINPDMPYAPLKRDGNYVAAGMSPEYLEMEAKVRNGEEPASALNELKADHNHYFVDFYDTMGEAQAASRRLKQQYGNAEAFEKDNAYMQLGAGKDMFLAFERLQNLLKDDEIAATFDSKGALTNVRRLVSDLYLRTLAESSARKSELQRLNVASDRLDMLRNFATQGKSDAHLLANLHKNGELLDAINAMRKEVRSRDNPDARADRQMYFNELLRRHTDNMSRKNYRVVDAINRGTSLWMLSLSPSYYLQNLTQPVMMSLPYMAGEHGYFRSGKLLAQAYKDLGEMVSSAKLTERMDLSKVPQDVKAVIEEMVKLGRIDIGIEQDLGKFHSYGEGKLSTTWNTVDQKIRNVAQKMETINRLSTAIAGYRAALGKSGATHETALKYADDLVRITHGMYDGFNAPRYMNTAVGKVLGQFKKFQIIQLSMMSRLVKNSFQSGPEALAARKALGFMLAHTGAVGGLLGLPGMAALRWMYEKISGDGDEPVDMELQLRRAIGDTGLADMLIKGAPAAAGVDLSGKLGMGQMLSPIPFADGDLTSRSGYEKTLTAAAGPFFGGVMPKVADAMGMIKQGDPYKAVEMLLPNGLSGAAKAYRVASEGVTQRNGDLVMSPDELSTMEEFAVALGLQPTQLSNRQFAQNMVKEFDRFYKDRESQLMKDYRDAGHDNDTQAMAAVRGEWQELQAAKRRNGMRVTPASHLLQSVVREHQRERKVAGGVEYTPRNRRLVKELADLTQ